ncbi:MAG: hypothetical protein AABX51_04260 [Nanoarchaeota archaeon]
MLDLINPYTAKILIAARDSDSIRQISVKIKESYGWTYKWAIDLEKTGVIKRNKQEIVVNKSHELFKLFANMSEYLLKNNLSLSDAYLLPNLSGLDYIFAKTDAVFVWTQGGYNIGRSKESYPIFIEILKENKEEWQNFFGRFGIVYTFKNERKRGIYFIISAVKSIEKQYCEGNPVMPLAKTVEWAKKYVFNFEPALEMLDQMYDLKINAKYAD